jgi:exosortase
MTETPTAERSPQPSLIEEVVGYWRQWPGKTVWFSLIAAWILLYQFLGNSTFGYIDTGSLFGWMNYAYYHEPDDQHGYLIPLVILVLFWWKRDELMQAIGRPWWPALGLVGLALGLHLIAYLIQQTRISIFAFYLGLYALMGVVWGRRFMVASFFPMVLCVFAVPIATVSQSITYPLRILVTQISVAIGHGILGMPIWREGSQIVSSEAGPMYDVAPACSGIRSLTVLGAITMIYAFVAFRKPWKRLVILLAAFPLAVAGNVARVSTLLVLGDVFGKAQAMQMEQYLGLVTFVVALGCLLLLGRWLRNDNSPALPQNTATAAALWDFKYWAPLTAALILMAATVFVLTRIGVGQRLGKPGVALAANGAGDRTQGILLPREVLDYSSRTAEVTALELSWLPKDTIFGRRLYDSAKDKTGVQLSVVLMGTDRTSLHKPEYCLDGQGWKVEKSEKVVVPIGYPHPYDLRVMKLTTAVRMIPDDKGVLQPWRGIYTYWYVSENELTPSHEERMWWLARDLIRTGVLQRWAHVSYFTACLPGQEEATFNHLKDFIAASVPEFQLATGPRSVVRSTTAALSGENAAKGKN